MIVLNDIMQKDNKTHQIAIRFFQGMIDVNPLFLGVSE